MNADDFSRNAKMHADKYERSLDQVISNSMYERADSLGRHQPLSDLISGCRGRAIASAKANNPELAEIFIQLGAELLATAGNCVTTEAAITQPSYALDLISSLVQ